MHRTTWIVNDRIAWRQARLEAARAGDHGRQILTLPQMAQRLAGGFCRLVDRSLVTELVAALLAEEPEAFAEIRPILDLPGTARAVAATLGRAWSAGTDLQQLSTGDPRTADMALIDRKIRQRLPVGVLPHADLAAAAVDRIAHAPMVLGPVHLDRPVFPDRCWRPVLEALQAHVTLTVRPVPGSHQVAGWVSELSLAGSDDAPAAAEPVFELVSCAEAEHEVLEALRWARRLLAAGKAEPGQIAIASVGCAALDPIVLAATESSGLPVCFGGGRPAMGTAEGQRAAAVADVMLRGIDRERGRRALRAAAARLEGLPKGWDRVLTTSAPLLSPDAWRRALEACDAFVDDVDPWPVIGPLLELMAAGPDAAEQLGDRLLSGQALALWQQALQHGPATAIDTTMDRLRVADPAAPELSILWANAESIAATPRPFTRLIGLNARTWPRRLHEDAMLPSHLVDPGLLEPVPPPVRDRAVFDAIGASVTGRLVFSHARRDSEGRLLRPSPLIRDDLESLDLRRTRVPEHAVSASDRSAARLDEFAATPEAALATDCWQGWQRDALTPHDGLVSADHPVVDRSLQRIQSATSLKLLLRDPLAYLWKYALGWREPEWVQTPLSLDPMQMGSLVHRIAELATRALDTDGGLGSANASALEAALKHAGDEAAAEFEIDLPLPPPVLWRSTLEEAIDLARASLTVDGDGLAGATSYAEVPFNQPDAAADGWPWDPHQPVDIVGGRVRLGGFIDRLDVLADGATARVTDYKTGRPPGRKAARQWVLNGGRELQRCIYAAAVSRLLPGAHAMRIEPRLVYPRGADAVYVLDDPAEALLVLERYLNAALDAVRSGATVPGTDADSKFNDFAFALPAQAKFDYLPRKRPAAEDRLGELVELWEED